MLLMTINVPERLSNVVTTKLTDADVSQRLSNVVTTRQTNATGV